VQRHQYAFEGLLVTAMILGGTSTATGQLRSHVIFRTGNEQFRSSRRDECFRDFDHQRQHINPFTG
jgi:hypothetical protein